jgi:predicted nuclease of predicted toxin-antitoxin system
MKALCDVHLSMRLVKFLTASGVEAIHVNSLPRKSESTDAELSAYADQHNYVVFTKDEDFRTSYLLRRVPRKLIHIRTGNGMRDSALVELIGRHLAELKQLDSCTSFYLEINAEQLTVIMAS